jgi:hypothetical protein
VALLEQLATASGKNEITNIVNELLGIGEPIRKDIGVAINKALRLTYGTNSSERDALGWCTVVAEASDMYRKNEDRIGLFFNEETIQGEGTSVYIKHLYSQYRFWAEDRGERPMTMTAFQKKLLERGITIEGVGSRAAVLGYASMPKAVVAPNGQPNYADLSQGIRQINY